MPARIASSSFLEEVKGIDPSLDIEWSDKHERWFVTQTSYEDGRKIYLTVVQDEGGTYRDLDRRLIAELSRMFFKDPEVPDVEEHLKKNREKLVSNMEGEVGDKTADITDYNWNRFVGNKVIAMPDTLKSKSETNSNSKPLAKIKSLRKRKTMEKSKSLKRKKVLAP